MKLDKEDGLARFACKLEKYDHEMANYKMWREIRELKE
jgi:hypothetical protein